MAYTLTIGDTEFELKHVNLKIRDMYAVMTDLVADLSMLSDEAADIADQVEIDTDAADTLIDKAKVRRSGRTKLKNIDRKRRELTKEIIDVRMRILDTILKKNGYKFDPDWWMENADINDVNGMIVGLMQGGDGGK